jgi:hypothetical protein
MSKASKKSKMPAPSARANSAMLRMDRARKQKAGTSAKQSRKLGSNSILLFQHQMDQLNANQKAVAKGKSSK